MTTSFTSANTGYIAGGTSGLQPLFLYTTDGGNTLNNQGMNDSSVGAMLSIRMGSATWGIAGGLGFIKLPCGAFTNDGFTWFNMEDEFALFCAFQGASIVDDSKTGVLIGSFSDRRDWSGNGLKMTTDGGQSWSQRNGDTGTTPVRYGSFLSKDMGYVTSGIWPSASVVNAKNVDNLMRDFRLTKHLSLDATHQRVNFIKREDRAEEVDISGYVAILSAVTNEAKDWKILLNQTNAGLYFNEISCTDSNNCWAVLEGIDGFGNDTAVIYHTSNGWATYDTQLTVPGGSLICIDMLTPTLGWAGGALLQGDFQGDFQGIFYKTTDGVNWTLDSELKNFYPMDVSVTDASHAYAAGITPIGLSSFASYSSS
eukprot:CAMPEP_0117029610 /NCGR_PEP_ID=MMETSP0472-20121206/21426_1 /TAXON_ID=693140 ORGANISM="Tiarina fusus, Strain LIS" /NCGR_SAMPLE_ID=MMETSP0472 /ASSEMBLY_ACC=CAM_ASM_000603 /LENGTH=368 /DNA_ID=CAMNT_0004737423 /DNA_START=90 /DNA_END=1196 /DNA_ORIENTATION=+